MRMRLASAGLAALIILAACGGGGSGGGSAPAQPMANAPVQAVLQAMAATTATYSGTAASGQTFALSIAPGPTASLASGVAPSSTYDASTVLRQNGQIIGSSTYRVFYTANPLRVLGVQEPGSNGTLTFTANQNGTVPATSLTGSSGLIFAAPSPPSSIGVGPLSATWSVEADSPTTAFVCINTTSSQGFVTTVQSIESDCFKVNAAGAIQGFQATVTTNGTAVVFK